MTCFAIKKTELELKKENKSGIGERKKAMAHPATKSETRTGKKRVKTVLIAFTLTENEESLVEKAILFSPKKIGNYILFTRLVREAFIETMRKFTSTKDSCEHEVPSGSPLISYVLSLANCNFSSEVSGRKRMTRLPFNDTISTFLRENPVYISRLFKLCYLLASLKILTLVVSENFNPADDVKVNGFELEEIA